MGYFPRNRSMTRYFSFTSFQPLTENFAATPPASAAALSHCLLFLPRFVRFFLAALLAAGYIPQPKAVLSGSVGSPTSWSAWVSIRNSPLLLGWFLLLLSFLYTITARCSTFVYCLAMQMTSCRRFILQQEVSFFTCPLLGILSMERNALSFTLHHTKKRNRKPQLDCDFLFCVIEWKR